MVNIVANIKCRYSPDVEVLTGSPYSPLYSLQAAGSGICLHRLSPIAEGDSRQSQAVNFNQFQDDSAVQDDTYNLPEQAHDSPTDLSNHATWAGNIPPPDIARCPIPPEMMDSANVQPHIDPRLLDLKTSSQAPCTHRSQVCQATQFSPNGFTEIGTHLVQSDSPYDSKYVHALFYDKILTTDRISTGVLEDSIEPLGGAVARRDQQSNLDTSTQIDRDFPGRLTDTGSYVDGSLSCLPGGVVAESCKFFLDGKHALSVTLGNLRLIFFIAFQYTNVVGGHTESLAGPTDLLPHNDQSAVRQHPDWPFEYYIMKLQLISEISAQLSAERPSISAALTTPDQSASLHAVSSDPLSFVILNHDFHDSEPVFTRGCSRSVEDPQKRSNSRKRRGTPAGTSVTTETRQSSSNSSVYTSQLSSTLPTNTAASTSPSIISIDSSPPKQPTSEPVPPPMGGMSRCPVPGCPKVYKKTFHKTHMARHMRENHNNRPKPICQCCQQPFKRPDKLKKHLTTHGYHVPKGTRIIHKEASDGRGYSTYQQVYDCEPSL